MFSKIEGEIKKSWNSGDCLVSISCLSYNHEKFIAQTLNGFLMQQTNFPFEILIHDDASTDNTANLISDYASNYPDIIFPILQKENQHSKLGGRINFRFNFPRAKGKYIALCEGDDYWTDPLKLQKQVDFLETHPDFNICFHNAKILKGSEFLSKKIYKPNRKENITFIDLLNGDYTKTCCSIFRFDKSIYTTQLNMFQDTSLFLFCLKDGAKAHYINEDMAVYRIHEGGAWGLKSTLKQLLSKFQIYEYLLVTYQQQNYTPIINHKLKKFSVEISFIHLKNLNFKEFFSWQKKSFRFYANDILRIYYKLLRKHFFNRNLIKKIFKLSTILINISITFIFVTLMFYFL